MSTASPETELTDRPIQQLTDRPTTSPRWARVRGWLSALVGLSVVAVAVSWSLARPGQASSEAGVRALAPRAVRVAAVDQGAVVRSHRYFAVTRPAKRANLALTVGGRLAERVAQVGDQVEAGTLLARIDTKPLRHAVAGARAQLAEINAALAQARRDVTRADALVAQRAATPEEAEQRRAAVDRLVANRSAARTRLAEARRVLKEGGLRAPFAGRVTAVHFEVGESVPPGRPVVSLAGAEGVEVEIEVPESTIGGIAAGQPVEVMLPLLGEVRITGTVERIGRESLGPGRLFPVVVRLPATVPASKRPIASGMTAAIDVQTRHDEAMQVPLGAVLDPAGGAPRVFRVRTVTDQRPEASAGLQAEPRLIAETVPVVVGALTANGRVALRRSGSETVAPLQAGDRIVTGGHFALLDQDPVQPVTP